MPNNRIPLERLERVVMQHARSGLSCIRCHREDGTVCGRHYAGFRQHSFGKGRGIKCHPFLVADFCNTCDAQFSEGTVPKDDWPAKIDRSEQFMYYALLSLIRRAEMGVI